MNRADIERILKIFPEYTNGGHDYRIPVGYFYQRCSEVLVGDVEETINAMKSKHLIEFYPDPPLGDVVDLQKKGKEELKRIHNII